MSETILYLLVGYGVAMFDYEIAPRNAPFSAKLFRFLLAMGTWPAVASVYAAKVYKKAMK